jgi:hypothetical protein
MYFISAMSCNNKSVDWAEEVACEEYPVCISGSGAARRRVTGGGKPETDELILAETLLLSVLTILKQRWERYLLCMQRIKQSPPPLPHQRRISCLPAPLLPSGIQHRSEELKADIWHLSGKEEEQGFHIRHRVDKPEVESGDDFRFPYS